MSIADLVPPQQASRSTRGRCPLYGFTMGGDPLDVLAQQATLTFSEGEHDAATISVSSSTLTTTDDLTDQPITFRWGISPRVETFTGYIMSVTESTAQGSGISLSFSMAVLGATKSMFDGMPRFWSNKSIPSAVGDLVALNSLGYTSHDHSYLWSGLAQTTESDWAVINRFADRLGFQIYNRYGVVMCHDPLKLFTESGIYTRLVMGAASANLPVDRVLLDFQPVEEADVLKGNLGLKFGYFTSTNDVQVASQPGDFKGYTFATDVVIKDQDAAKVYTDAGNIDMDRWQQYALARVWGDADIYPGMCVEVVTTNKQYLKPKYDGKWIVRSTSHQMDRQQYQSMLYLARPDGKTLVSTPAYTPFWQDANNAGRARPALSLYPPSSDLDTATWVSSWSDRRAASVL